MDKTGLFAFVIAFMALGLAVSTEDIGIVNNYYNTTGGDEISFNGSAVDMNGSSFYNGSQQAGTFNHSNLTSLSSDDHPQYNKSVNFTKITNNQTWFNITGLDIRKDGAYLLEINFFSYAVGGSNLQLFINNDTNISNYTRQYVYADATFLISARDHDPGIIGTQQNWGASAVEYIYLDAFGRGHYVSQASLNGASGVIFFNGQYTYDNFSSNINTLNLYATVANGIGNGTEIYLKRV